MIQLSLLVFIQLASASSYDFVDRIQLEWQIEHSSDVGHFKYIRDVPISIQGASCGVTGLEYEVVRPFKGNLSPGDRVRVWGEVDSKQSMRGERILFLTNYRFSKSDGYDACHQKLFTEFKQIHLWCCAILTQGELGSKAAIFYDMLDSETRGPDIPVPLEDFYRELESYSRKAR